ncbi:diaminopimelate decarboxylase [Deinococcus cellulosilyticus]|uniref:Diaminopimelate decarboxylase n=1 Tax=Deinococcus cellulosilyticus (strain DSM 18568 / NBRC 106333 / KACC 11606 / 5516J-15) TaxID=1223518 RepID=A0A511N5E5_DEIC1|nr:diaminopimelate decarboxylase [Deinococcus cellulosilyticus]GEM48054.1 diaminopimelate decarboxylase [Deinococcus cellulosilyticus NBRC 106333 = KACC 11606]
MLSRDQLLQAAETYGTPLYVYDARVLDDRIQRAVQAFQGARIFFAMKANSNLHLLRRMKEQGLGFEVVSYGELRKALHAGVPGDRILVNGPAKTPEEYALGQEVGATFILDRLDECHFLNPGAKVIVRVNPELHVSTHSHLATGEAHSKFGVPLGHATEALQQARNAGLNVRGLHLHIGSAIQNPEDFREAFEKVAHLADEVGHLEVLDVGGGWGLNADLEGIAKIAFEAAQSFGAELWVEPGRFLVSESGVLLTRVVGTKETARKFILLDAGMTEILRPMLYGAQHPLQPLWESKQTDHYDLAGPACESGDLLARNVELPVPTRGDVLVLEQAGAYGAVMSSTYLTRPRPAEVMWDGEFRVIRQRENLERLWELELAAES